MPMGQMYRAAAPRKKVIGKLPMPRTNVDAKQNVAIKNLQKKVRRINNEIEVKWKDTQVDVQAMTPVAVPVLLNPLVQGDTSITRTADTIKATSIQMRGSVLLDADNLSGNICRVIIFWDRQPNGVAPVFSDVLDTTTITSATSNTIYAPYNLKNAPRFKILYDKAKAINVMQDLTTAAGTVVSAVPCTSSYWKAKIPLNRECNYGLGNAGTIADISSNALFVLLLSDIPAASQPPNFTGGFRFLFHDA